MMTIDAWIKDFKSYINELQMLRDDYNGIMAYIDEGAELLKKQEQVVRCKDCKHWDKTTREEGNDCVTGPWEDAVCEVFREWDSYGDLGELFRRTNGDWFCADGKRR